MRSLADGFVQGGHMALLTWLVPWACTGEEVQRYTVPDGEPSVRYAPFDEVLAWPDDLYTVEDPDGLTGRQVRFQGAAGDTLRDQLPEGFNLVDALETLDGWGTTGALFLQFTEPVDPASFTPENVRLVALEGDAAALPYEVSWEDDGTTAFLVPLMPLDPATGYGLVAGHLTSADGDRIYASEDLGRALEGTHRDVRMQAHAPSLHQALDRAGLPAEDAAAVLVFTTQSLFDQDRSVAAWLQDNPTLPGLVVDGPCVDNGVLETCAAALTVQAFTDPERRFAFGPQDPVVVADTWTLGVELHLPLDRGSEPLPVVIYGHGLGGDRGESGGLARDLAALGMAVVAIDAPAHGEHPTATSTEDFFWIFHFFGIDPATQAFDVFQLRNHWRIAAHDKLQLAAAVRSGVDVDADGTADLDTERVFYAGHSLGGIMGAQLLALDPGILGADLSVPGGRVTEIVHRSQTFAGLVALMKPSGTTDGDVARFFAMLQSAIDRGDAANWAPQALSGDRDLLVTMVLDDEVIPNSATRSLARALGVEHVGPLLQHVEGLAIGAELPISANVDGRTAAFFQYEHKIESGDLDTADHFDAHSNDAAVVQFQHFWDTRLDTGVAEVIEPFEVLGF